MTQASLSAAASGSTATALVIGIGNLLRKDDGVGLHVLRRLEAMQLPEHVSLLDGGTAGIDLISYLEGIDRLIIIDAIKAEGMPGDIRVLDGGSIPAGFFLSGHYGRLTDLLGMAGALWLKPVATIVGIIPADCTSYEIGLSQEVSSAVDRAAQIVLSISGGNV